ncbi:MULTISPECIES: polysaccharide deacetylase family protein [Salinibaculum]|uniref:polysaccharide deacetylase family protein n=1 Tax=Salinibaculum TaxID=2732368 RepID=UPI0030D3A087
MQAVMYHYVRPNTDQPPYEYYYLDLEDFRRQLDYFEEEYGFVGRETFLSCLNGETGSTGEGIILTFDDGLRDHHEWVLPELRRRGLWGLFFISGPLQKHLLPVHRIHSILGTVDHKELIDVYEDIVDESDITDAGVEEFGEIYSEYDSAERTQRFKRGLNYLVPYDRLPAIFEELNDRVAGTTQVDPAEFYMTREQLRELSEAGMLLGGHTVTHPALSRLSPEAQREEIHRSLEFIQDVADPPVRTFAYPYGGSEMYNKTTVSILDKEDCDLAFTTEAGNFSPDDMQTAPLTLPRKDCNEYEHGEASIA